EKNPGQRYPTAEALAEDLERWLRHEPIQARPGGMFDRSVKWVRRNRAIAGTIGAIAALGVALGVIVWQSMTRPTMGTGNLKTLAVILRAANPNSASMAKECSRDLIDLCTRLSGVKTLTRTQILKWESSDRPVEQIAQALGASAVLMGELRQDGDAF